MPTPNNNDKILRLNVDAIIDNIQNPKTYDNSNSTYTSKNNKLPENVEKTLAEKNLIVRRDNPSNVEQVLYDNQTGWEVAKNMTAGFFTGIAGGFTSSLGAALDSFDHPFQYDIPEEEKGKIAKFGEWLMNQVQEFPIYQNPEYTSTFDQTFNMEKMASHIQSAGFSAGIMAEAVAEAIGLDFLVGVIGGAVTGGASTTAVAAAQAASIPRRIAMARKLWNASKALRYVGEGMQKANTLGRFSKAFVRGVFTKNTIAGIRNGLGETIMNAQETAKGVREALEQANKDAGYEKYSEEEIHKLAEEAGSIDFSREVWTNVITGAVLFNGINALGSLKPVATKGTTLGGLFRAAEKQTLGGAGTISDIVEAGGEAFLDKIGNSAVRTFAKGTFGAVTEMPEEAIQTGVQNYAKYKVLSPLGLSDYANENDAVFNQELYDSAIGGFIGGIVLGGIGRGTGALANIHTKRRVEKLNNDFRDAVKNHNDYMMQLIKKHEEIVTDADKRINEIEEKLKDATLDKAETEKLKREAGSLHQTKIVSERHVQAETQRKMIELVSLGLQRDAAKGSDNDVFKNQIEEYHGGIIKAIDEGNIDFLKEAGFVDANFENLKKEEQTEILKGLKSNLTSTEELFNNFYKFIENEHENYKVNSNGSSVTHFGAIAHAYNLTTQNKNQAEFFKEIFNERIEALETFLKETELDGRFTLDTLTENFGYKIEEKNGVKVLVKDNVDSDRTKKSIESAFLDDSGKSIATKKYMEHFQEEVGNFFKDFENASTAYQKGIEEINKAIEDIKIDLQNGIYDLKNETNRTRAIISSAEIVSEKLFTDADIKNYRATLDEAKEKGIIKEEEHKRLNENLNNKVNAIKENQRKKNAEKTVIEETKKEETGPQRIDVDKQLNPTESETKPELSREEEVLKILSDALGDDVTLEDDTLYQQVKEKIDAAIENGENTKIEVDVDNNSFTFVDKDGKKYRISEDEPNVVRDENDNIIVSSRQRAEEITSSEPNVEVSIGDDSVNLTPEEESKININANLAGKTADAIEDHKTELSQNENNIVTEDDTSDVFDIDTDRKDLNKEIDAKTAKIREHLGTVYKILSKDKGDNFSFYNLAYYLNNTLDKEKTFKNLYEYIVDYWNLINNDSKTKQVTIEQARAIYESLTNKQSIDDAIEGLNDMFSEEQSIDNVPEETSVPSTNDNVTEVETTPEKLTYEEHQDAIIDANSKSKGNASGNKVVDTELRAHHRSIDYSVDSNGNRQQSTFATLNPNSVNLLSGKYSSKSKFTIVVGNVENDGDTEIYFYKLEKNGNQHQTKLVKTTFKEFVNGNNPLGVKLENDNKAHKALYDLYVPMYAKDEDGNRVFDIVSEAWYQNPNNIGLEDNLSERAKLMKAGVENINSIRLGITNSEKATEITIKSIEGGYVQFAEKNSNGEIQYVTLDSEVARRNDGNNSIIVRYSNNGFILVGGENEELKNDLKNGKIQSMTLYTLNSSQRKLEIGNYYEITTSPVNGKYSFEKLLRGPVTGDVRTHIQNLLFENNDLSVQEKLNELKKFFYVNSNSNTILRFNENLNQIYHVNDNGVQKIIIPFVYTNEKHETKKYEYVYALNNFGKFVPYVREYNSVVTVEIDSEIQSAIVDRIPINLNSDNIESGIEYINSNGETVKVSNTQLALSSLKTNTVLFTDGKGGKPGIKILQPTVKLNMGVQKSDGTTISNLLEISVSVSPTNANNNPLINDSAIDPTINSKPTNKTIAVPKVENPLKETTMEEVAKPTTTVDTEADIKGKVIDLKNNQVIGSELVGGLADLFGISIPEGSIRNADGLLNTENILNESDDDTHYDVDEQSTDEILDTLVSHLSDNPDQDGLLIDYLFNELSQEQYLNGEKLDFETAIDELLEKTLRTHINSIESLINTIDVNLKNGSFTGDKVTKADELKSKLEDKLKNLESILEKDSQIKRAVANKMVQEFGLVKVIEEVDPELEDGANERIYSKESYEENPKKLASVFLKQFLTGIVDENSDANGFLGLSKYHKFDTIYDAIINMVIESGMFDGSYDSLIEILSENETKYPWVHKLIENIESADGRTINALLSNFNGYYISMNFVLNDQFGQYRVFSANIRDNKQIQRKQWEQVFLNNVRNLVNVNTIDDIKKLYTDIHDELNAPGSDVNKLKTNVANFLNYFGITLTDASIDKIFQTGLTVYNAKEHRNDVLQLSSLFNKTNNASIFTLLYNYVNNPHTVLDAGKKHPFSDMNSALNTLLDLEYETQPMEYTSVIYDNGKLIYTFAKNNYTSNRTRALKLDNANGMLNTLLNDEYSKESLFLKELRKHFDNPYSNDFYSTFNLEESSITPYRNANESTDVTGTQLSKMDQLLYRFGLFQDTRHGSLKPLEITIGDKVIKVPIRRTKAVFPTISDKSRIFLMNTMTYEFHKLPLEERKAVVKELLYSQLVKPELNRIRAVAKAIREKRSINWQGMGKAGLLFCQMPQLNLLKHSSGKTFRSMIEANENFDLDEFENAAKEAIYNIIAQEVRAKANSELGQYMIANSDGFVNDDILNSVKRSNAEFDNKKAVSLLLFEQVVNHYITQANISMMYSLDPTQYAKDGVIKKILLDLKAVDEGKEPTLDIVKLINKDGLGVNQNKRFGGLSANGTIPVIDFNRNGNTHFGATRKYYQIMAQDRVGMTENMKYLIELSESVTGEKLSEAQKEKAFALIDEFNNDSTTEDRRVEIISELKKIVPEQYHDFLEIKSTDAQEYTTAREHVDILYATGKLDDGVYETIVEKLDKQYEAESNGNEIPSDALLTTSELKIFLQPMKPVYYGAVQDEATRLQRIVYVKSASVPLLPQVVQDKALNTVRKAMEKLEHQSDGTEERINVRLSYQSANKVGAVNGGVKLWNRNGSLAISESVTASQIDEMVEQFKDNSLLLDRKDFKIQQEVPRHQHDEISLPTQLIKIVAGAGIVDIQDAVFELNGKKVNGQEIVREYLSALDEVFNQQNQKFLDRFGLNPDGTIPQGKEEKFLKKVREILIEEAKKDPDKYSEQDLAALKLIDIAIDSNTTKTAFAVPLWLNTQSEKFESLINSIFNKSMMKFKLPGFSLVCSTDTGFAKLQSEKDMKSTKDGIVYTSAYQGRLRGASVKDGVLQKPQIFVPFKFTDQNGKRISLKNDNGSWNEKYVIENKDGSLSLNEKNIPKELLTNIGLRIPTSSHVSMSSFEIAGFLPDEFGDVVILPDGFNVQMGLDYDVDKMYFMRPNIVVNNGKLNTLRQSKETYELVTSDNSKGIEFTKIDDDSRLLYSVTDKDGIQIRDGITKVDFKTFINSFMSGYAVESDIRNQDNIRATDGVVNAIMNIAKEVGKEYGIAEEVFDEILNSDNSDLYTKIMVTVMNEFKSQMIKKPVGENVSVISDEDIKGVITKLVSNLSNFIDKQNINDNITPTEIKFETHSSSNYTDRTKENARNADVTIAIATDFTTAGEIVTRKYVNEAQKTYAGVQINDAKSISVKESDVKYIVDELNSLNKAEVSLNIAGNGIYSFTELSQETLDNYVYELLKQVSNHPDLKTKIVSVRSGGQTGIDEAGAKAGSRLGLETTVLTTSDWKYRTADNKDTSDEKGFKERFIFKSNPNSQAVINKSVSDLTEEQKKYAINNPVYQNFHHNTENYGVYYKSKTGESSISAALSGKRTQTTRSKLQIKHFENIAKNQGITDGLIGTVVYMKDSKINEGGWFVLTSNPTTPNEADFNAYENWDESVWGQLKPHLELGTNQEWKSVRFQKINDESNSITSSVKKINVYSRDKNGYESLSNFAERPFDYKGQRFHSVEQAFQYTKAMSVGNTTVAEKILNATKGSEIKNLGSKNNLPMTSEQITEWNENSKNLLTELMRESFMQNEEARNLLTADENIEFTHELNGKEQDNGRFSEILNQLRNEFKTDNSNQTSAITDISSTPATNTTNKKINFNNASSIRNTTKRSLEESQNKLYQVIQSILSSSSPEVQGKINSALSMDVAKNAARVIDEKRSGNTRTNSIYSDEHQIDNMASGAVGKVGIGVYSNALVLNSVLQQAPAGNKTTIIYRTGSNSNTNKRKPITEIKIGDKKLDGTLSNAEKFKDNGRTINEAFAEKQNTATDNANENILDKVGINKDTLNIDVALLMIGVDLVEINVDGKKMKVPYSYLFLSHPIIKDYLKFKGFKNPIINNAVSEANAEKFDELRKNALSKINNPKMTELDFSRLTGQFLYDGLNKPYGESNDNITEMIMLYEILENVSKQIKVFGDVVNITKEGIGNSVEKYHDKVDALTKTKAVSNGGRSSFVLDHPLGKAYGRMLNIYNHAFSEQFYNMNAELNHKFDAFLKLIGKDNAFDKNEIKNKMFIALKEMIVKNKDLRIYDFYKNSNNQFSITELQKSMLVDSDTNTSLASYLLGVTNDKAFSDYFKTIELIKRFDYNISDGTEFSTIDFNGTNINLTDETNLKNSLLRLIKDNKPLPDRNGKPYTTRQLAIDLITYTYLGRSKQGPVQFVKYIPQTYLEAFGFGGDIQRAIDSKEFKDIVGSGEIFQNFFMQFIQHNPEYAPYVKFPNMISNDFSIPERRDGNTPRFVRTYDKNLKKTRLFHYDQTKDGKIYYIEVSTLGNKQFTEYQFRSLSNPIPSILDANNPTFVVSGSQSNVDSNVDYDTDLTNDDNATIDKLFAVIRSHYRSNGTEKINYSELLNHLQQLISANDITIKIRPTNESERNAVGKDNTPRGSYNAKTKTITLYSDNTNMFKNGRLNGEGAFKTLIHELIHHLTIEKIDENIIKDSNGNYSVKDGADGAYSKLLAVYNDAKRQLTVKGIKLPYGMSNIKEFVSEVMSNPDFIKTLNELPYKQSGNSILNELFNVISRILGIKKDSIAYTAVNEVLNIINDENNNNNSVSQKIAFDYNIKPTMTINNGNFESINKIDIHNDNFFKC